MGIFEKNKGSGVWWVLWYQGGKRHREKVGSKSNALKLYQKRKGDALAGEKMPELRRKRVTVSDLIDDAVEFARAHNSDLRNYEGKASRVRAALGDRDASSVTPQEIGRWLSKQCRTSATYNRYKSFLSLCFREGMANGKVNSNPARLVRQKKEVAGRMRFLSRSEADRLAGVIEERYPQHHAAFLVALHTGMRLSEQYGLTWKQVDLKRGVIELGKTKNGTPRTIPLNSIALAALQRQHEGATGSVVFPRRGATMDTRHWFHPAMEAAGITGFVWHGLRHTFCSWLAMAGVSLKTIQELAGHKTISMSARYSHLSPDHTAAEVERIAAPAKVVVMKRKRA